MMAKSMNSQKYQEGLNMKVIAKTPSSLTIKVIIRSVSDFSIERYQYKYEVFISKDSIQLNRMTKKGHYC